MRVAARKQNRDSDLSPPTSVSPGRPHHRGGAVVDSILRLQRTVGNRGTQRLLRAPRPSTRKHPKPPLATPVDSKIEMPNDLARATQQGKADAERLRRSGRLSDEDRQRLNTHWHLSRATRRTNISGKSNLP